MSEPQNNQGDLKGVLKEIVLGQVRKLHESAELTGENFNVFSILHMESAEVKTHSAIIAELLNPRGSHNQGTLFLKLFLEKLLKKDGLSDEDLKKFKVGVEVSFNKGRNRIDILIEKEDCCIVIENKVWAGDQPEQLKRYSEYPTRKGTKPTLIYLTPDGAEPEKPTLGDLSKDEVICLSYCNHIIDWVDDCIKEVSGIPRIRETLHQYQMTVRKLTGQLPPEVEDILNKDVLGENSEKLQREVIEDLQHELQCEFWKELKKRLADKEPNFQLYNSDMEHEEILDNKLEENICHPSLGLTFSIPNSLPGPSYDEHEVAFRVFYERAQVHSYFTYGFVFRRKDTLQRDKIKEHKDALEQYRRLGYQNEEEKDDGWISWTYFRYEPGNFITESKESLIRRLTSEINLALSKARQ